MSDAVVGIWGQGSACVLNAMSGMLKHRGPGEECVQPGPNVWLAVRHGGGAQRIASQGPYTVLAHGVVAAPGQAFASVPNPAASVLDQVAGRGLEGLAALGGDYAAVIWNGVAGELSLATDYLASRPLHYATLEDGTFVFATEYKAFLAVPGFRPVVDLDMVQHLQHCKHLPPGRTLLQGVATVPPGCTLTFGAGGRILRRDTWPVIGLDVRERSASACADDILASFHEALRRRLEGRGRIGIALSGGIDSMAVACACRRLFPDADIHTFTAFHGEDDPERLRAARVAAFIRSTHHEVPTPPELMRTELPALVWHIENPIARSETLQLLTIGRVARDFVDCLMTGVASDGLFAGMPKHKVLWMAQHLPLAKRSMEEFYVLTQTGLRPRTAGGQLLDRLYFKGRLPGVPRIAGTAYQLPASVFPEAGPEYVNRTLAGGFQGAVAGWLPKFERVFAASNVDVASPFLDPAMIRVAFTIPDRYKIVRGKEKFILRRALRSTLPPELLNTPKAPQRMRHDSEFAGVLDAVADRYLSAERVGARGWFDPADIQAIRASRRNGVYVFEAAMRLWTAVLTEVWAETFLDRRGGEQARST